MAGGDAYQREADSAAGCASFGGHGDGVEDRAPNSRAQQAADHTVFRFLERLADDAIDRSAGSTENRPGDAARNPCGGIAIGDHAHLRADGEAQVVDEVGDNFKNKAEDDAERKREHTTKQRFGERAFGDALGNAEAHAHERDDRRDHHQISPTRGGPIHEAGLAESPAEHCAEQSGGAEIKPSPAGGSCLFRRRLRELCRRRR